MPNGSGHYPNGDTGDRVCRECADDKYYLIWEDTAEGYYTASTLLQGVKLTTTNDGTTGYVVDISHWDSGDFYAFDSSHPDDKVAQLEGLVEHQTTLTECSHPVETWHHHYDPDSRLGDYYTCGKCGEITQVG